MIDLRYRTMKKATRPIPQATATPNSEKRTMRRIRQPKGENVKESRSAIEDPTCLFSRSDIDIGIIDVRTKIWVEIGKRWIDQFENRPSSIALSTDESVRIDSLSIVVQSDRTEKSRCICNDGLLSKSDIFKFIEDKNDLDDHLH